MSLEQLKAFLAKVKGDSNLRERLKAAKTSADVVGIAKEHGHEFTAGVLHQSSRKLTEEELEGVTGGQSCPTAPICGNMNFGCCTNTGV